MKFSALFDTILRIMAKQENLRSLSERKSVLTGIVQNRINLAVRLRHVADRVDLSADRAQTVLSSVETSISGIANQLSTYETSMVKLQELVSSGFLSDDILRQKTAEYETLRLRVYGQEEQEKPDPVAIPARVVESTQQKPTVLKSEPTTDKPKSEKTSVEQETITLPFRNGRVETKRTQGALIVRKLIQRPKTIRQLCIEILDADTPENRKHMSYHIIPDAKKIAEQNGHLVAKFIKDKETGYSLKKQKVKKPAPVEPTRPVEKTPATTQLETKQKRKYERKAIVEKGTSWELQSYILPNGKKVEFSNLQITILSHLENGISNIEELSDLILGGHDYEHRLTLSRYISRLNKLLEPHALSILNLTSRSDLTAGKRSEYSYQYLPDPENPELDLEKVIQNTALEESEKRSGFTSYESAILAHQLSEPNVVVEFEEKRILALDKKLSLEIQEASGNRKPPANKKEMQQLRNNILAKMQKIIEENKINDSDQNYSDSTMTLLTYFLELENKLPDALQILKTHLEKDRGLKRIVVDNGRVYYIGFGDQATPIPTARSRWGHDRTEESADAHAPTPDEPAEPIDETVGNILVFDASLPKLKIERRPRQSAEDRVGVLRRLIPDIEISLIKHEINDAVDTLLRSGSGIDDRYVNSGKIVKLFGEEIKDAAYAIAHNNIIRKVNTHGTNVEKIVRSFPFTEVILAKTVINLGLERPSSDVLKELRCLIKIEIGKYNKN